MALALPPPALQAVQFESSCPGSSSPDLQQQQQQEQQQVLQQQILHQQLPPRRSVMSSGMRSICGGVCQTSANDEQELRVPASASTAACVALAVPSHSPTDRCDAGPSTNSLATALAAQTQEAQENSSSSADSGATSSSAESATLSTSSSSSSALQATGPSVPSLSVLALFRTRTSSSLVNGTNAYSPWRLPMSGGKLPVYVQRQFRLKAMGLVCLQLLVVLIIMIGIQATNCLEFINRSKMAYILTGVVALVLTSLCGLFCFKALYPVNYIFLVVLTLFDGIGWSIGAELAQTTLHIQIVFIMCAAIAVAAVVVTMHADDQRQQPWSMVLSALLTGWLVAALLEIALAPMVGLEWQSALSAAGVTLLLFCVFALEVGRLLADCDPDSFMTVVITMNSVLLVIISVPLVWALGVCMCMSMCLADERFTGNDRQRTEEPQQDLRVAGPQPGDEA